MIDFTRASRWKITLWPMLCVLLALTGSGCARKSVPVTMQPLEGKWAEDAGRWSTTGDRPPSGWYLRGLRQYDLGTIDLRLQKNNAQELVFIYLRHWEIVLRPKSLTARYTGFWNPGKPPYRYSFLYFYSATRQISYETTDWVRWGIFCPDGGIAVSQNGKEVLRFISPEAEWGQKVRASGKFPGFDYRYPERVPGPSGDGEVLIVHGYGSGLKVEDIKTTGRDAGEAQDFYGDLAPSGVIGSEDELPLQRPSGVTRVTWSMPKPGVSDVGALPAVEGWEIPATDFVDTDPKPGVETFPEEMIYRVGAAQPGRVPRALGIRRKMETMPQALAVEFQLKQAGVYTLQMEWPDWGMGWGPNLLQLSVDGKPVLLESYRALTKPMSCSPGGESIPLELSAGPHKVEARLVTDSYGYHFAMKHLRFPIGHLRLVKGEADLWREVDVRAPREKTQLPPAFDDEPTLGEWNGSRLSYRLRGLKAGEPYSLELIFRDMETSRKESRVMTLRLNQREVETGLDVFAQTGWGGILTRKYQAHADGNGEITVQLAGGRRKAFVNALRLSDATGKMIFRENFGWSPALSARMRRQREAITTPRLALESSPEPAKWTPDQYFDGHNLVANSHFSLLDPERKGMPRFWYSLKELSSLNTQPYNEKDLAAFDAPLRKKLLEFQGGHMPEFLSFYHVYQGEGEFGFDPTIGHQEPGSIRIGATAPEFGLTCNFVYVNPGKRQRFTFHARGKKDAAPVRATLVWFAMNMDADAKFRDHGGAPLLTPRLQYLSKSQSEPIAMDDSWREVSVTARPPEGAVYAAMVIDVAKNGDSPVWIDDASFNGYGAEPLEITQSFAGYHPQSDKTVVVKSLSPEPVNWSVRRGDAVVRSGALTHPREEWFSQHYYHSLDLSSLQDEGTYRLIVKQGADQSESSLVIDRNAYHRLADDAMAALRIKRINDAVPNGHDPDLLDYAAVPKTRTAERFAVYEPLRFAERIDLTGGYYDAGDEIKHVEFWPAVVLATQNALIHAGRRESSARAAKEETDWVMAALHKFILEDGTMFTSAKPQGYGLDNVPRYANDPVPEAIYNVTQTAGSCAMSAFYLKEKNPELSRKYQQLAILNYNAAGLWKIVEEAKTVGSREISAAAKSLWAEMYLDKLTGDPIYKTRAARSAKMLAEGLKKRAYADLMEMFNAYEPSGGALQDCAWVPVLFLKLNPAHSQAGELRDGLRAFASHVKELSAETIWGQSAAMNGRKPGAAPARFPVDQKLNKYLRMVGYWPMLAYTLSEIGMTLHDPAIVHLAERQLQWCLGKNFADLSIAQGVGPRWVAGGDYLWFRDLFFMHWLASDSRTPFFPGNVTTASFRDVGAAQPIFNWGDHLIAPFVMYPQGYCYQPVQPPYGFRPGQSETYLPQLAQYSLAVTSVAAALDELAEWKPR